MSDLPFIAFRATQKGKKPPAGWSSSTEEAQIVLYEDRKITIKPLGHEAISITSDAPQGLKIVPEKDGSITIALNGYA